MAEYDERSTRRNRQRRDSGQIASGNQMYGHQGEAVYTGFSNRPLDVQSRRDDRILARILDDDEFDKDEAEQIPEALTLSETQEELGEADNRIAQMDPGWGAGMPGYEESQEAYMQGLQQIAPGFFNLALDFVPFVGDVKGIAEAIVGRDITGQELAAWERVLGAIPLFGGVLKRAGTGIEVLIKLPDGNWVKTLNIGGRLDELTDFLVSKLPGWAQRPQFVTPEGIPIEVPSGTTANIIEENADGINLNRIDNQPGGNQPSRMEGNQTSGNLPRNTHLNVLGELGARSGEELLELARGANPFEAFENAREMARVRANLGDDAIPFLQEIGPHRNNVYTGMESPDGLSGWRIDFDPQNPEKGFHVNWWFREGPKRRDGWYSGAITIEEGTQQDYWETVNRFPRIEDFIGE